MPPPPLLPSLCLTLFFSVSLALLLPPHLASAVPSSPSPSFSLDFFPAAGAAAITHLALSGGATANATSGAISLPIPGAQLHSRSPVPASALRPGFSTYFSFALPPFSTSLAFFLTPSAARSPSPPALALVFSARHVRLELAGRTAIQTETHTRHPAAAATPSPLHLHAWIDYHHTNSSSPSTPATDTLHVRLAATRVPTPTRPLLTYPLHLPPALLRGPILAGFRTSSGNCTLLAWAFRAAPSRVMHSLPLNPTDLFTTTPPPDRVASARAAAPDRRGYASPWGAALALLLAAAAGAVLTLVVLFLWYSVSKRRPVAPVEFPMHPSHLVYEKIVLVGVKDDAAVADSVGNK